MKTPAAVARIFDGLDRHYPDADTELAHRNAFELLAATMLSAQSTDARVNLVTPALFARYRDAQAFADADIGELEKAIQSTGFFRNKAKNIQACCRLIVEKHGGQVPGTMEELFPLPGIGRKTANVVMNMAFGHPTMAVDTHVLRVSNRIGLSHGKTPLAVEDDLMRVIPKKYGLHAHHWLILHGRYLCKARKPECGRCLIADLCQFAEKTV